MLEPRFVTMLSQPRPDMAQELGHFTVAFGLCELLFILDV
jgi:hypothetical protein